MQKAPTGAFCITFAPALNNKLSEWQHNLNSNLTRRQLNLKNGQRRQVFTVTLFTPLHCFMFGCSEFHTRMESRSTPMPSRRQPSRSASSDSPGFEKTDGSQSDSAVSSSITEGRSKQQPSLSHKMATFVGLRRGSSSANQLGTYLDIQSTLDISKLMGLIIPPKIYLGGGILESACRSVGRSVCLSVCLSVCRAVGRADGGSVCLQNLVHSTSPTVSAWITRYLL